MHCRTVDVISVIATFLPPTTKVQQPLMLVNHTWLEGVAGQDGMKPKPHISWPYAALRLRDPSMLCLVGGKDRHVADLAQELPRLKAVQLYSPPKLGMSSMRLNHLSDESLLHVGKLKLLRTLRMEGLGDEFPTDKGMKYLASLRHLTPLSATTSPS